MHQGFIVGSFITENHVLCGKVLNNRGWLFVDIKEFRDTQQSNQRRDRSSQTKSLDPTEVSEQTTPYE